MSVIHSLLNVGEEFFSKFHSRNQNLCQILHRLIILIVQEVGHYADLKTAKFTLHIPMLIFFLC